ncbi:IPT/TIG domain-containing protein, partial [Myxococcota bacterium]|nr:IPT/TIG domain-containing protein [Myxococcota bacterium]
MRVVRYGSASMVLLLAGISGVAGCQGLSPDRDVCGIESCDLDALDATTDFPDINDTTLDFWRPDDPGPVQDDGLGDEGVTPGEFRIDAIDPGFGSSDGSTTVTLSGAGLDQVVQVWFGRARSPSIFPIADGILNCVAPPGAAGPVTLRAVDRFGRTAISPVDFVYQARLRVESVFPVSGPSSGGTPITIAGSGFSSGVSVLVGGRPAISVSVADDGTILAISPPGSPGVADVRVTSAS